MCKYCEKLFTGNSSENLNEAEIHANGVFMGSVVTFLEENDDDQPVLRTILMNDHAEAIATDGVIIGWCPICGRKLSKT